MGHKRARTGTHPAPATGVRAAAPLTRSSASLPTMPRGPSAWGHRTPGPVRLPPTLASLDQGRSSAARTEGSAMDGHATEAITRDTRPVVVGVDRSDSARDAAEWAADLASVWGVPLRLVHVAPGTPDDGPNPPAPPWLAELARGAERAGADVDEVRVVSGATVEIIADQASRARL